MFSLSCLGKSQGGPNYVYVTKEIKIISKKKKKEKRKKKKILQSEKAQGNRKCHCLTFVLSACQIARLFVEAEW